MITVQMADGGWIEEVVSWSKASAYPQPKSPPALIGRWMPAHKTDVAVATKLTNLIECSWKISRPFKKQWTERMRGTDADDVGVVCLVSVSDTHLVSVNTFGCQMLPKHVCLTGNLCW